MHVLKNFFTKYRGPSRCRGVRCIWTLRWVWCWGCIYLLRGNELRGFLYPAHTSLNRATTTSAPSLYTDSDSIQFILLNFIRDPSGRKTQFMSELNRTLNRKQISVPERLLRCKIRRLRACHRCREHHPPASTLSVRNRIRLELSFRHHIGPNTTNPPTVNY